MDRTAGLISLESARNANTSSASVSVLNQRSGYGVIVPAERDGSFKTPSFAARDQDHLMIDYAVGGERSDPLCVVLRFDGPLGRCP